MKGNVLPLLSLLAALCGLAWLPSASAAERLDPAFAMLPTPVVDGSLAPRLARIDEQRAALTWLERTAAGHRLRFSVLEDGQFGPAGTVAEGSFFANWADTPGLTVTVDGTWVAHWLQRSGTGTYAYDVRVAISQDEGLSWGDSFTPHRDGTRTEHGFVSYFSHPAGAGLTWLDGRHTLPALADRAEGGHDGHHHAEDGAMTLRSAVVRLDGSLAEEALLDDRVCDCCVTASANTDEGPVVVYRDRSEEEVRDIAIVRHTEAGWSAPRRVHEDHWRITACPVNGPAIIAQGQRVVVAWFTLGADDTPRVHLAQSRDGGRHFGTPLTFDRGTSLGRVDLAWDGADVLMSWMARDEENARLRLARLGPDGARVDTRDIVRLPGSRGNGFPRLLTLAGGDVLLTWTEGTPSGPRVQVGRLSASPRD